MPLVAIVGRPNVGKSTLFNRFTETKQAIVHDEPGVTRDRIYGEVEWNGRLFSLVDTGGFVPRSAERFEKAIREQVHIALDEADVVLFVADVITGVTDLDRRSPGCCAGPTNRCWCSPTRPTTKNVDGKPLLFINLAWARSTPSAAPTGWAPAKRSMPSSRHSRR